MAVSRAQLEAWFATGLIPTEIQYDDVWDSFIHVDDVVPYVFDWADVQNGWVSIATTLPNASIKTDAEIWQAVTVYEGRGTLFQLDYGVPMGFRINNTLNNIELIDKNGHPTKFRIPPANTRLIVLVNKKFV